MNDIDEKIRQALNAEDQKILDRFGDDPGPIGLVVETFKGNQRWFTTVIWIGGFMVFAFLLYCGERFIAAEDLKTSIAWSMGIMLSGMGMVIVKIGSWQQMHTQNLMREIKRLELRWLASMEQQNKNQ